MRETNDVPKGEQLLREWLLKRYYKDALNGVTRRLAPDGAAFTEDPDLEESTPASMDGK